MTTTKHQPDTSPSIAPAPPLLWERGLGGEVRSPWPLVPLGEILRKSDHWIEIDSNREYSQVTVRLWGKGVALRGRVQGSEIAASRQLSVKAHQFILSRIDARNGAFGLVPAELEGAVVSNDFPTFDLDVCRVLPAFLAWMSKTHDFVELCQRASEGTTNRVRLKEERFLVTEIPLPPLDEQRRIVARIEAMASRIEEARRLRQEAIAEAQALIGSEEMCVWPDKCMSNAVPLVSITTFLARGRQSQQGDSDTFLIKTQHVQQGHLAAPVTTLDGSVAAKITPNAYVQSFDILIACSAAGCLGRVAQFMGQVKQATTDTHVAIVRANPAVVLPDYLYAYLRGAQGQIQLRSRERGDWQRKKIGFRLTELNLADLKEVPVPLPPLSEQVRILQHLGTVYAQIDALNLHQAETAAELDALLPAVLDRAFRGEL